MLALSTFEGTIVVSATGAVILAALLAFGIWWFKPLRRDSGKGDLMILEEDESGSGGATDGHDRMA